MLGRNIIRNSCLSRDTPPEAAHVVTVQANFVQSRRRRVGVYRRSLRAVERIETLSYLPG